MEKYSKDKKCLVMTRAEVRAFDSWAINTLDIPGMVLMENAGRSCAELIQDKMCDIAEPKVCIFCGIGNNGGDGYVIARILLNAGLDVMVVIFGNPDKIKGDALLNLNVLKRMGQPIQNLMPTDNNITEQVKAFAEGRDIVVDCVFGTGLDRRLEGGYLQLVESINSLQKMVLSVDIPSGLDCDTGRPLGDAVKADYTVTFVAVKKGFTFPQSALYTGEVHIASIGINPHSKAPGSEA